jgi:pimeloyl-ACP methyl ester carboxylesterase
MREVDTILPHPPRPLNHCFRRLAGSLTLCALLAGCSAVGVKVRSADSPDVLESWQESLLGEDSLSPRTQQTLRRWGLERIAHHDPAQAFRQLEQLALRHPGPDPVFALAELAHFLGQETEKDSTVEACAYYYLSAGYAYHYLFDGNGDAAGPLMPAEGDNPFDPRFRLACDLYNAGLSKCIRAAQRAGRLDPNQQLHLDTPSGKGCFTLTVSCEGFSWPSNEFGPLLFCSDYKVSGLTQHHRTYGLGVPLIGIRNASTQAPGHAFYPREISFPVTAFFDYPGTLADLNDQHAGHLRVINPLAIDKVVVRDRTVPLETDLTTPLAYYLARNDLNNVEYTGFLRPGSVEGRAGIYMFEPYQPGKIPVLMVHGLLSSPLTWAPMYNDLRADPSIRDRFQFWFYLYPTGLPYLQTSADLREDLARLRAELDPRHDDPALDELVLVGHSMGGLISRLMTVSSGDDFWHLVSRQPFDALKAKPDARSELERTFFFGPQPGVRRVVFLGTPHRGSKLSPSTPGRLAASLVRLPQGVLGADKDLLKANPEPGFFINKNTLLPTSVDLLAPHSPALEVLSSRPLAPTVHFHSIIGRASSSNTLSEIAHVFGETDEDSDGVVPYWSAHIAGVDSEIVVAADHVHVHHHPLAILEVRRILEEHWKDVRTRLGVMPAKVSMPSATEPAGNGETQP